MSRTLSKILVICALVVIVPLMVVGTTLAAYYSIDSSITIAAVIDGEECDVEGTYALVSYDGNHDTTLKVTTGQTKVVEVEAYYTPYAYTFKGWFKGDAEAYNRAKKNGDVELSTEKTISIDMGDASDYVAVYEVVKFKVSGWDYKNDPSAAATTDQAPADAHADGVYKYGEALPTLSYAGVDYNFAGWQVKNDAKNLRYFAATFGTEYSTAQGSSVVLTNPWLKTDMVTITYVGLDGRDLFSEEVVKSTSESYTLKTPGQISGLQLKNGYEYAWTEVMGGANTTATVTPSENKTVYLQEKEVDYTATVASNYKPENKNISFSESNKAALEQLFAADNWTTEHAFWKVETVKIVYNENTYDNADALFTAIKTANPHANGEIAVSLAEESIHKYFSTISAEKIEVKASENMDSGAMWQEVVYKPNLASQGPVNISEINGNGDVTTTVEIAFNLGGRDQWQTQDGKSLKFAGLYINGDQMFGAVTLDFDKLRLTVGSTMLDVIDKLIEISPEILEDPQDVLKLTHIIVGFTYEAE